MVLWLIGKRMREIIKHHGCVEFMDTALSKLFNDGVFNYTYLKVLYNEIIKKIY